VLHLNRNSILGVPSIPEGEIHRKGSKIRTLSLGFKRRLYYDSADGRPTASSRRGEVKCTDRRTHNADRTNDRTSHGLF